MSSVPQKKIIASVLQRDVDGDFERGRDHPSASVLMAKRPNEAQDFCLKDLKFYERLVACDDPQLKPHIKCSLEILADALRLYGTERCISSYNGGKDADVVLHLTRAAVAKHCHDISCMDRPKLAYFEDPRDFEEVGKHVKTVVDEFSFDMRVCGANVKDELTTLVNETPQQMAFVLGTRKGDPNCGSQGAFAPSSSYMPKFMRVNPILDWSFGTVWQFLREFEIPYCSLYDEGYTSLGRVDNTAKNPLLRREDGSYGPAYSLKDFSMERAGRESKASKGVARTMEETRAMVAGAREVSLLVVGDEVLQGKVAEENSKHALSALRRHGVEVRHVSLVRDDVAEIEAELRALAAKSDLVFTSGGVGPTHDDVTLKAVAHVVGTSLETNRAMLDILRSVKGVAPGDELSTADQRLAILPVGAQLLPPSPDAPAGSKPEWPLLLCGNVFVLPGVPKCFQTKFDTILRVYIPPQRIATRRLTLAAPEPSLVTSLDAVVAQHPDVKIGSYPVEQDGRECTVVTVEGRGGDSEALLKAVETMEAAFGGKIVSVDEIDSVSD